jgi:hypothetical protein
MADLLAATSHAKDNQAEIEASTVCGCFHCLQIFSPAEIMAWSGIDVIDFENPDAAFSGTALCPRCGSESVIGDKSGFAVDSEFLGKMHDAWFQRTIIRRPERKG